MYRYVVVLEKTSTEYSAYAPDVSGVGAVGETIEETLANMQEALEMRFEGILGRGRHYPK